MPKATKQKLKKQKPMATLNPEYIYANFVQQNQEKSNIHQFLHDHQNQFENQNLDNRSLNHDHWQHHKLNQNSQENEDIDQYFDFAFNQNKAFKNKEHQFLRKQNTLMAQPFSSLTQLKIDQSLKMLENDQDSNVQEENYYTQCLQEDQSVLVQSDSQSFCSQEISSQNYIRKSFKKEVQQLIPLSSEMKLYDQDSIEKKKKDLMEELVEIQEIDQHQNKQKNFENCINQSNLYENLQIFKISDGVNLSANSANKVNFKKELFKKQDSQNQTQKGLVKNNVTKFVFKKSSILQEPKRLHSSQRQQKQEIKKLSSSKQKSSPISQKKLFESQKIQNSIKQKNNKSLRNTRSTINQRELQRIQKKEQSNQNWEINVSCSEFKNKSKSKSKISLIAQQKQLISSQKELQKCQQKMFLQRFQEKQSVNPEISAQPFNRNYQDSVKINSQSLYQANVQKKSLKMSKVDEGKTSLVQSSQKQVKFQYESQIQQQEQILSDEPLQFYDEDINKKSQFQTYQLIKFSNQLQEKLKLISSMKNSMRIIMNYHKITTKNQQIVQYQQKVHQVLKSQVNKLYEVLNQKQYKARQLINLNAQNYCKFNLKKNSYYYDYKEDEKGICSESTAKLNLKQKIEAQKPILLNGKGKKQIMSQNVKKIYNKDKTMSQQLIKSEKESCHLSQNYYGQKNYKFSQKSCSQNSQHQINLQQNQI